jgi:phosphonate transport system substrate-binding protein
MLEWMRKVALAFILLALALPSFAEGKEFRLGVISDKPVGRINQYGPLARYVAKDLEKFGVTGGKMVIAKNSKAMAEKIRKGEVDVIFESAFAVIELREEAGIIPRLLIWKKGSSEYHSVIFVRKESPIQNLNDLKGKTIVFEDPLSTSAYLLPKADLRRTGLTVLPLGDKKGSAETVRFVFGEEETNQAFFVLQKRTDAGAFSSDDWRELPVREKNELRVIHESQPVLRYIAAFNPALPTDLSDAIASILIRMSSEPEGTKILKEARIGQIEELSDRDRRSLVEVQELIRLLGE